MLIASQIRSAMPWPRICTFGIWLAMLRISIPTIPIPDHFVLIGIYRLRLASARLVAELIISKGPWPSRLASVASVAKQENEQPYLSWTRDNSPTSRVWEGEIPVRIANIEKIEITHRGAQARQLEHVLDQNAKGKPEWVKETEPKNGYQPLGYIFQPVAMPCKGFKKATDSSVPEILSRDWQQSWVLMPLRKHISKKRISFQESWIGFHRILTTVITKRSSLDIVQWWQFWSKRKGL
jgi:hypothetical protein